MYQSQLWVKGSKASSGERSKGAFIKRVSSRDERTVSRLHRRLENQAHRSSECRMFHKGVSGKGLDQHTTSSMFLPTVPSTLAWLAQN